MKEELLSMKLNKKFIKIFGKILVLILTFVVTAWLVMFCIDYRQCLHYRSPIFVKASPLIEDKKMYYGIFYKVEQTYGRRCTTGEVFSPVIGNKLYLFDKMILQVKSDLPT